MLGIKSKPQVTFAPSHLADCSPTHQFSSDQVSHRFKQLLFGNQMRDCTRRATQRQGTSAAFVALNRKYRKSRIFNLSDAPENAFGARSTQSSRRSGTTQVRDLRFDFDSALPSSTRKIESIIIDQLQIHLKHKKAKTSFNLIDLNQTIQVPPRQVRLDSICHAAPKAKVHS